MNVGLVSGRRVVRDAGFDRGLDRGAHRAVLEERLVEEAEVVDQDVRAGGGQAPHGVDEGHLAVAPAGEEEPGAGRQVVNDLQQRGSLVAASPPASRVVGHRDQREIAG